MHETSGQESYRTGHRVFDCPWCGAISGIDPSHIGEHFTCPECHRETKLTSTNTRQGHLTEGEAGVPHPDVAAGAPHPEQAAGGAEPATHPVKHDVSPWETYGRNHRVFDCPWCGAISSIDPTHLGDHYACPECKKETKLTPQNTRSGDLLAASPDAPPHPTGGSRAGLLVGGLVVVAAVIVAIVLVLGSGPSSKTEGGTEEARTPGEAARPASTEPAPPTSQEAATHPETQPAPTAPGVPATTPEPATPEPVTPEPATPEPSAAPETPAPTLRQKAEQRLADAEAALLAWQKAHPDEARDLAMADDLRALESRVLERLPELESKGVTPETVRAWDARIDEWIAKEPTRVTAAESLETRLAAGPLKPRRFSSWKEINFYEPGVRARLAKMVEEAGLSESEEHAGLVRELEAAKKALAQTPENG